MTSSNETFISKRQKYDNRCFAATIIVYFYDNKKSNVQLTQFFGTKIAFVYCLLFAILK